MKRLAFAAALAGLLAAGTAHAGEVLNRITQSKTMTVATAANWPPQSFVGPDNTMQGFDVDVAKEIAKRLGAEAKFVTPDWGIITAGRWSGRWDISVGSMTPTTERTRILDFPAVYYYTPYVFAVHQSSPAASRADLNGKVIGVEAGTTTEDYINGRLKIDAVGVPPFTVDVKPKEVRTYGDSMGPLDDLRLGNGTRLDATVSALPTITGAVKRGYPVKALADKPAYYEPLAIAIDKGDADFGSRLTAIVDQMKADGTLKTLSQKWYGDDLTTLR